jgi:hypothetical protein
MMSSMAPLRAAATGEDSTLFQPASSFARATAGSSDSLICASNTNSTADFGRHDADLCALQRKCDVGAQRF